MINLVSIPILRGEFVAEFAGSGSIPFGGTTGVKLTLTPPAGQRVRLTHFSTQAPDRDFLTIKIGEHTVVSNTTLQPKLPNMAAAAVISASDIPLTESNPRLA